MENKISLEIERDIKSILNELKSSYEIAKELSLHQLTTYLNEKSGYIEEIIEGLSKFLENEIESIEEIYFYKVINIFYDKLDENNLSTRKFINKIFPILMNKVYNYKTKKQKYDNLLFNIISDFIKKYGNNIGQIENNLNLIFDKLTDENTPLDDYKKYAVITILGIFLHDAPIISFYKIIKSSNEFKKILSNFKHKNKSIRKSVKKLIEEFLLILLNKDSNVRKDQTEHIIYDTCIKDYIDSENNNEFVIHGLILVLKSFTVKNQKNEKQINEFFKEKYKTFLDFLYYNLSTDKPLIKISIIQTLTAYCEYLPDMLEQNENLEYFEKILNNLIRFYSEKEIYEKIKSEILRALGRLSLIKPFEEIFSENIQTIIELISKDILENKTFNESTLYCLSDIMTFYGENLINLLPFKVYYEKIFAFGLKESHLIFLEKLLSLSEKNSEENIQIIICILNVISFIIIGREFNFKFSKKKLQLISLQIYEDNSNTNIINKFSDKKNNISHGNSNSSSPEDSNITLNLGKSISAPLNDYLNMDYECFKNVGKVINNYIKEKKDDINNLNEVKNALQLLGYINNENFEKDILNFYLENCISMLKKNDKEMKKIIISLAKSSWFPKMDTKLKKNIANDYNFIFIFQNFINLLLIEIDDEIKLLILETINEEKYFQLLSKYDFFIKFVSLFQCDNNSIIEKSVEIVSKLISYNYNEIHIYINGRINQICLFLITSNNQYRIEKNIILLNYLIKYTANNIVESLEKIFTTLLKLLKKETSKDFNILDELKKQNDVIILKVLSVISELMNNQYFNKNILDESLNDIMLISISILEDNITFSSTKEETVLKAILSILVNTNKDWKIYSDYIDLVNIIIQVLSKSQNKQSRLYAMKIFGYIGTINPDKLEIILNLNDAQNENGVNKFYIADEINNYSDTEIVHQKNELMEGEKNKKQINKLNVSQSVLNLNKGKYKKKFNFKKAIREKTLNSTTYYSMRVLMKILLNNNNYDLNTRIIILLKDILVQLNEPDYPIIYLILPTLLYSIDNFEENTKIFILEIICFILKTFTKQCLPFVENILFYIIEDSELLKDYNEKQTNKFLDIIDVLCELYSNEISSSYSIIISMILNLLSDKSDISVSTKRKVISCLNHIGDSLSNYFSLVIPKLTNYLSSLTNKIYIKTSHKNLSHVIPNLFLTNYNENLIANNAIDIDINNFNENNILGKKFEENDLKEGKKLQKEILDLIYSLLDLPGITNYMERIINTLCCYLKAEPSFQNYIIQIFIKMLNNFQDEFIFFFPFVIKFFKKIQIPLLCFFQNFKLGLEKNDIILMINENLNESKELASPNEGGGIFEQNENNKNINFSIKNININNSFTSGNDKSKSSFFSRYILSGKDNTKYFHKEIILESLVREFETKNCLSEDDWHEWFKVSSKKLFEESPSYILFLCYKHNVFDAQIINELYNSAFYSLWIVCPNKLKNKLIKHLESILKNPKTPNAILLKILNLIEFINKEENETQLFDFKQLGEIANICKAHAKALYYVENEYINNDSSDELKKLINLYIDLELPESVIGIYRFAQMKSKMSFNNLLNEKDLHLKLHQWKKALKKIEEQQKKDENGKFIFDLTNEKEKNLLIKKAFCLEGLSDWENLLELGEDLSKIDISEEKKELDKNDDEIKLNISLVLAKAALNLGKWDELKKYSASIKSLEDDDLYEEKFFKAIVAIKDEEYDNAKKYIDIARDLIDDKIKMLLNESYERAYKLLLDNENLCQLEDIIKLNKDKNKLDIKEYKQRKENLKLQWDKCLELKKEDIKDYERIIGIRKIILTEEEDYNTSLDLSQICRKKDNFTICIIVLNRLQNNLKNCDPDISARVRLAMGKFIHDDNDDPNNLDKAIAELEKILNININKVCDPLKSKIYCYYGMWCAEKIEKKLNEKEVNNILKDLQLSTKYNQSNYKAWHSYALLNYKFFEYGEKTKINYAINAIEGFTKSICIGGKNISKILQDLLLLLNIWFQVGMEESIDKLMNEKIDIISLDSWFMIIPQLLARINVINPFIRKTLISLLKKIGLKNPRILTYPLTVLQNSKSKIRAEAASLILKEIKQEHEQLFKECELIINELNRCALCLNEEWIETIEESSKLFFQKKDIKNSAIILSELHKKMQNPPKTMNEVHFYQTYRSELNEAYKLIKDYLENNNLTSLKEAWDIYHLCFRSILINYSNIEYLDLKSISPELFKFRESEIEIPGIYQSLGSESANSFVKISSFSRNLTVLNSKKYPRKIVIYGSDGKEYAFLLKGHEDIRQDERIMQLFGLINTLLSKDADTREKNLFIKRYPVIPLSNNSGLIGWVSNCDTLHQLIKEYRQINKIPLYIEQELMDDFNKKYDTSISMTKLEVFKYALSNTLGIDLYKVLWNKSQNAEDWLDGRTNYSRSLAVMSIVGYILGLGDRHPSNIMLDRISGKILHIDFGDCFEVAMKRDKFPEKVPFRLTRMLIKALEIGGIEGTFRISCENVMKVVRENKDSLNVILAAFVHDPLISFRLLIPLIMKQAKNKNKNSDKDSNKKKMDENEETKNINNSRKVMNDMMMNIKRNENEFKKKRMESDERQLYNELEEKDDTESDDLNKIAKLVLERVSDKLNGTDFNKNEELKIYEQIQRLIRQATSHENLSQSYLGWCPFW